MIGVSIHDRQQLEIEIAYPLQQDRSCGYDLDLFLFVPPNVGINPHNYTREDFYRDLNAYLRADSRPLGLMQLADPGCAESPLNQLDEALHQLERDVHARPRRPIFMLIRLFGHAFRESLRRAQEDLLRQIDDLAALPGPARAGKREALLQAIAALGRGGHVALLRFRQMRRRFEPLCGARPAVVRETFEHVDEFATAYFLEQMEAVAAHLQQKTALYDGSGVVVAGLLSLTRSGEKVAAEQRLEGFASPAEGSPSAAEFYTYRRRLIRKSMERTFYLETRALRRDPYVRNAIAMVAAGLAAIWSLVAQVPATLGGLSQQTRLLVLGSAVLAYMLKDRIKELTKERLAQRLRHFDHDNLIIGDNLVLAGLRGVRGRARERMRWIAQAEMPGAAIRLRTHPRTVAGSDIAAEQVIAYQRSLHAGPERGQALPEGFALRDMIRLNLHPFMARLEEPTDLVGYYDLRGRHYRRVQTPKVYHLNLVLMLCRGASGADPVLLRYRIVLDKEGIVRVEPVGQRAGVVAGVSS